MGLSTLNKHIKRHIFIMYMADQTARLYAGQSRENTDYYRTIALIEQRTMSRECTCRVLIKCGLWDPATAMFVLNDCLRIRSSIGSWGCWSTFANG